MGRRALFGIESGGLLALLSVPCTAITLFWMGMFSFPAVLIATTPASLTAFLLALTVLILRDLAGDGRLVMPMNLAYPLIFGILNLTVARAIWFSPGLVRAPHEVLNPIQVWFDPRTIVLTFVVQVIALTIACKPWQKESSEPSQAESDPAADGS